EDYYVSRRFPEPRWIPRREPVIHGDWSPHSPLTREQHDAFVHDGFLVLENLFRPDEIAVLESELSRLRGDPSELQAETIIAEPRSREIRSIFAVHNQNFLFKRLAMDQRLIDIARHILGDEVYIHQSRLNYKPGYVGKEFYWHSDF